VAATAAVYREVGGYGFVFDDGKLILGNAPVLRGLTGESVRWALTATYTGNWHPLTWLSHLADVSLFGPQPGPPHLVNLAVHVVNALLLLHVLRRLTGRLWPSAFAAALLALHPLHVESVAWVSERKDLLCALFWLLATAAYLRYVARPSAGRYLAVAGLFVLGLASKAMIMTFPVALLLLDWWPLGRLRPGTRLQGLRALLLEKAPLLAAAVAGGVVALFAQRATGALGAFSVYRPAWRLANAVTSYAAYLGATAWPAGLSAFYPFPLAEPPAGRTAAALLLLAAVTAAALALARRAPALATGWLWYLVTLVPVIGLVQVGGQARADRYLYLPMTGLAVAAAWGTPALARRARLPAAGLAAVALAAFALAAARQAGNWRTNETLFRHALAVTGENWVAHAYLGEESVRRGDPLAGVDHYREAVRLQPESADMHFNLAVALGEAGLFPEAVPELRSALWLRPGLANARFLLGVFLARAGSLPEAVEILRAEALRPPPRAEVWDALGDAALRLGLFAEAETALRESLRLHPGSARTLRLLQQAQARRAR
jgi:tetratricopeptide (TPR) repeat protein